MMHTVVFDVDGVLADFLFGYTRIARQLGYLDEVTSQRDSVGWDDYGGTPKDKIDAVWAVLKRDSYFWESLPSLCSRAEFARINALQDQHAAYFATNRPGLYPKAQTEHWLMSQGILRPTVVVTGRKGEFARAVNATHSLEDKAGNAVYIAYESPTTRSYLVTRAYNQFDHGVLGSKVTRVDSVSEFLDQVEAA